MSYPGQILKSAWVIFFLILVSRLESQIPGKSVLLNGQTDYVEIADHNSLDIAQNLTIEAWINPCSFSDYNAIVTKQWCNNSQLSYYFGLRNGYLEWAWDDDGQCSFSSLYRANSKQLVLHKWSHVAVVHSSSGVTLYLDGQQVSGSLIQGAYSQIRMSNSPVRVGVYRNQSGIYAEFFDGRIDDVRIWRAALQQASIFNRKNSVLSGAEVNLVAYYPMEDSGTGQGTNVSNLAASSPVPDGITVGTPISPSFVSTSVSFDQLFIGNDTTLYIGESILLNAGSSGLQFSWQNGSTDSTFSVSAAGIYWVDAFIGDCSVRDSIVVSYNTNETPCGVIMGSIYGDPDLNETADCLAPTPQNDGMYVAGIREQQVILMRLTLKGVVSWSKVFDVVQNKPEFVNSIMVDSDGNILLSGIAGPAQISQGGTPFALKYDPIAHLVLWSKEFTTHPQNYNNNIIQKGAGGNYLLSNNPHLGFKDDEEIIELNVNTGDPVPTNTRNYRLMASESINLLYHEGFVYGVGRYTSNAGTDFMRHTIVKIDPDDGSQLWVKMGHIGPNNSARLYGVQMVIDQDEIYSCYFGDPNGTSLSTTKMFVQKTSTSGTLRWVKQYDLPGGNDAVYAIAKSGNGFVLLAGQYNNSLGLNLFKIDTDGKIIWSKKVDFDTYVNATPGSKAISKLIAVGNILAFTSNARNASGEDDMLIGRTDLNGESDIPCLTTQEVSISVIDISNPQFYSVTPGHTNTSSQFKSASQNVTDAAIEGKVECVIADTLYSTIVHSMCTGDVFEGYTEAGTYVDLFPSIAGCDIIRTLILDVGLPSVFQTVSFCEGGSFENYNEGGVYMDTLPGSIGCDTVRHLTLIETPAIPNIIDVTICSGTGYFGYETEGIYTDTFQSIDGCDSVRILHLSVMNEIITNKNVQICLGDVHDGYVEGGIYFDTLQSVMGCDSIIQMQLTVIAEEKFITVNICEGGSFEQYNLPGQYIDTIQGFTSACDTIRHITLVVLPAEKTHISYTICAEDHYNGHTEPGEYSDTLITPDGCITIQTVLLSVREPITSYTEASLCDGSIPGHHLPRVIVDTLISSLGCDSIRTLSIEGPSKYIPNAFSPNQDGNNDLFEIFASSDTNIDLDYFAIFDRFGDMTYETSAWPVVWDGNRLNGQPHPSGVYAYILIYQCGEERIIEHGNITLVK